MERERGEEGLLGESRQEEEQNKEEQHTEEGK